ncbi:MAG: hypothetical protein SOY12_00790 [Schaedlerella sp.]|nr:hypothetical protein [Lachnospiraceae bacterium]MDY4201597.1 hypothetical protein [Schaedlerella sp.]
MDKIKKVIKKKYFLLIIITITVLIVSGIVLFFRKSSVSEQQNGNAGGFQTSDGSNVDEKTADKDSEDNTGSEDVSTGNAENTGNGDISQQIGFPYDLEDGKLQITTLFQSSVPNPDCDFKEGIDIASIELLNQSGQYLKSADITLTMEDGTELRFEVLDIPDGDKVWAFDINNTSIASDGRCINVQYKAVFEDDGTKCQNLFLNLKKWTRRIQIIDIWQSSGK